MLDATKLLEQGVVITHPEVWDGEPGVDRHSDPDPSRVSCVFLNLSPQDWCQIAMCEGEDYIGGCCGTASAMQDIVNGIFRKGGYADADDLYTLGEYAKNHPDGFEDWGKKLSQEEFDARCGWSNLGAWDKITLCWHAVRDKIKPNSHNIEPIIQENRPDLDERREIDELSRAIHYLRYSKSGLFKPQEDKSQHVANDLLVFAKLYPSTKKLLAKLEADNTTWSGFAIVEKARPEVITHNGYGACLYNQEADAREVIRLWDRDERYEKKEREKPLPKDRLSQRVLVRPVTVSVKGGTVFGDPLHFNDA
jgi:hypothetical protein